MSNKILITGIGGFVASHLARYCLEQGDEVIGTYRWNEDLNKIKDVENKIKMVPADLLDLSSLIRAIADNKPPVISHLAAQSFVPDSFTNPIITVETNAVGTVNLLEAIRLIKEYIDKNYDPLIHICSTSEIYGKVEEDEIPITEEHPMRPANPYAVGKLGTDGAAYFYHKYYDFRIITTRMFTHCGIGRTMMSAENNFSRQIALIEKGEQEPVVSHGNLDSVRTWADVRDAVKAYYKMFKFGKVGEVYNIGGNYVKTIGETLDYLISLSPMKDKITKKLDPKLVRKVDVNLQIVDTSKFQRDVDWKPEISFEKLMQDLRNWWREEIKK